MPESRQRKKAEYTPQRVTRKTSRVGTRRWVAPAMVGCWLLGLAWIIVYYLAPNLKYFDQLGNWNLLIGMVLIGIGFIFSTRWE